MTEFLFGDFSEQEAENLFGHDKQGVKFPWAPEDCLDTAIEFGFDVPPLKSSSADAGVSYPTYNSCNDSLSHHESTSSALTSPPGSSKSSSIENVKLTKQSSSHHRHHSDRKLKKKRPPNYYKQEYQQMLEPSTLQLANQNDQRSTMNDSTPIIDSNSTDPKYISCDQWVDSTMKHQHDDKQSTNDSDDIDSDERQTTTDTDNDNDQIDTIQINRTPLNNNDLAVYSTSVASAASIETLKPSESLSSSYKSKPSSWADLFRSSNSSNLSSSSPAPPPPSSSSSSVSTGAATTATTTTTPKSIPTPISPQNGRPTSSAAAYHPKTNYHVYNSNGEDSRTLDDYFSKCEIRPSAMAIKPRGLINRSNYCYVNATLQSLLACPAFFNVMKHIPLNEDQTHHQVPFIRAFHSFVNQFEKMDRTKANSHYKDIICGKPFDTVEILQELSRLRHVPVHIIENKQEDAHELLCQFLNELHEEICQIMYSTTNKNEESISSSDLSTITADLQLNGEEKAEDWLQVGKRNRAHVLRTNEIQRTLISDIFGGKFRSTVHSSGTQRSVTHEPFFTLSLDIKDSKITNIDEALLRFCEQSTIADYVDNKSRQNVQTHKTMLIEHLPPILIIHLKCFLYDGKDGIKKLNKSISYAVNLALPKGILTEQARKQNHDRYKLFAVEYHLGDQASKGHYITDVFHPGLQGWIRHDDSHVHVITSNQVINSSSDKLTPYLLFYRRGD